MQNMKLIISALTIGVVGMTFGQLAATDHGNMKANNQRTGVNGDVAGSSPGRLTTENNVTVSSLRWFRPQVKSVPVTSLHLNEINPLKTIIDNTDLAGALTNLDSGGNNVGPYDPLPTGTVASSGTWNAPLESEEALYPYTIAIRRNQNLANPVGFTDRNPNPRWPAHLWAASTASKGGVSQDPRQAIVPANINTFSWIFTPKISTLVGATYNVTPDATPKGYALYVWIPAGLVSPGGVARPRQRYWAYEITYGIGQKYVDVVDTEASGAGWVRLGNGGHPTNQLFQYAGLDGLGNPWPITITLYNTIPRDSADNLTETVNAASPDNRFAVFADAALFSAETDQYVATPTSAGFGDTNNIRVTGARNERLIDTSTIPSVGSTDFHAKPVTVGKGVVTSYDYNTGVERWRYSPLEDGPNTISFDDTNPRFIYTGGFVPAFDNTNARGGEYLKTPVNTINITENVNVNPQTDLADGSYQIQMYVGGNVPGINYAQNAQYEIIEGGVSAGIFTLDMSTPGYKTLGNRRYVHSSANPLRVVFYNYSAAGADAGRSIYVDQVRFVGSVGTEITSTPVHAFAYIRKAPGAAPVETAVVIVADERGRLHCLDANGNGDGTTTCYWTYPSTLPNTTDPNLQPGRDSNDPNNGTTYQKFDGESDTLEATMPSDFDLSTAVVQRMTVTGVGTPRDFLIIGSKNGRVYNIAMEGRGDYNVGTHLPGTTFRRWTFPETYPAAIPKTSQLGSIASVVTGQIGTTDVVYVATEQGRIYCLNAQGDFTYTAGNELKTNIIWQYPPQNVQTFPAISGAPVLDQANNRLFFGTHFEDDNPARFMALDSTTGNPLWATTNNSISDTIGVVPTQLDWFSGACYVPAATLNTGPTANSQTMPDTVFAMNENGNVYAIDAGTGNVLWRTNELQSGGVGSLVYTRIMTYDAFGGSADMPVVMVPTDGGRFAALFARLGEQTRFGNRLAWGYEMDASIQASMTVSNKWLFGATTNGYLLAWSDLANTGANLGGESGPGYETAADNDPAYDEYRNCEVAFLSRTGFVTLRQTLAGTITGTENYGTVIDTGLPYTKPYGRVKTPFKSTHGPAFEWGETIYLIAYNFPFSTQDTAGNDVAPPVVEATVTTEGSAGRPIAAEARVFRDKTSSDPDGGYAIFQIPLTAGGGTSKTPGPGSIRVQIRTSAVNHSNTQQSITLNPALTQLDYRVANPIGISVEQNFSKTGTSPEQLGYTVDPTREDALANGSPDLTVTGVGTVYGTRFGKSVGTSAHNASKKTNVWVFDRSLITLLRGEGRGLDLVKVDRKDLRWQGGQVVVAKPFAAIPGIGSFLGNFEDLPVNYPNNSLDYPDIAREQVKVRKEPNGNVENPVFNTVSLKGPRTGTGVGDVDEANASTRVIVPTTFEFQVDVPHYQPVNLGNVSIPNQNGSFWQAGYVGRFTVYVDSDQSGSFGGASREAYRTFNLGAAVSPDEKISIGTPNIDLGSLASGSGYDARLTYSNTFPYRGPLSPTSFFNPDSPQYKNMFKPVIAYNEGNVNLWNVRVAKGSLDATSGLYWPWQVLSSGNNDDVWLDAATDLHSSLDSHYAPFLAGGVNTVFTQKPRVGDSQGRQIVLNPSSRLNQNIPGSGLPLVPASPNITPVIGVTPPLGMPSGRYTQTMRLIEDTGGTGPGAGASDESLSLGYTTSATVVPLESYSDPTFTLSFTVKETQLTGGNSAYTAAGVDNGNVVDAAHTSQWADLQPSGMRLTSGDLMMAFASNRPSFYPAAGNTNPNSRNTRIYVGQIAGGTLGAPDSRAQDSQIRDLNKFVPDDPANQRWVKGLFSLPSVPDANVFQNNLTQGVPTPMNIGGTLTADVSYGNPVWSSNGDKDLAGNVQSQSYVVYTGTAKRQTNSGIVDDSRIIVSKVSSTGGGGASTFVLDADPFSLKGRPTMVQNGNDLTIFYPAFSNGVWTVYVTTFNENSGFTVPRMLEFGSGFESIASPSVVLRTAQLNGVATTEYDLTFTGRLRNSGVNEVFMARLDPTFNYRTFGTTAANGQIVETAVYDARFGSYRVRGAYWQGNFDVTSNGATIINSTPVQDRQTKLWSANTIFGGRMVMDPMLGTVKFTGTSLPKSANIQIQYTPTFMRLSDTNSTGYNSPSALFDTRLDQSNTASNFAFWKTPSGINEPSTSTNTYRDRLIVTAVKSAAPGSQTARPAMSTFRLGIRLGRSILVNPDGSLAESVTVSGNTGSYQIDPAAGRIYFTHFDEDRTIRIQLGGGGGNPAVDVTRPVTFVGETAENFVTMDTAVNESNLYMFLDPVGTNTNRRGMIWMLWSSTRNGAPSVFMQTIARKITPILPSN